MRRLPQEAFPCLSWPRRTAFLFLYSTVPKRVVYLMIFFVLLGTRIEDEFFDRDKTVYGLCSSDARDNAKTPRRFVLSDLNITYLSADSISA